ncbi:MAG: hypothetical protein ACTHK2_08280 [Dokdonella sp.]|uniref:hypothetical protein n=1 Tax=Dokdonella sp. TaxID=2291710 RepID=UPI003F7EEA89
MLTTPRVPGGLTRSPIGIIALFIALIYSLATALFGVAAGQLTEAERQPLIYFIVVFPVIVLGVFCYLVTCHHLKLYAPNEYPSEASFLKTLDLKGAEKKLREEVSEIKSAVATAQSGEDSGGRATPGNNQNSDSATKDASSQNSAENDDAWLGRRRPMEQFESPKVESLIVAATALGVRLAEKETDKKFVTNVGLPRDKTVWDAGLLDGDTFVALEVKLAFNNFLSLNTIHSVLERAAKTASIAKTNLNARFSLFFVVAATTQNPGAQAKLIEKIEKVAQQYAFPVFVRSIGAPPL